LLLVCHAPQAADFGPKTALKIVDALREQLKAGKISDTTQLRGALKDILVQLLEPAGKDSASSSDLQLRGSPAVVLIVGVNGAGKTTTIGKLAHRLSKEGAKVRHLAVQP
jgi:fused signal recognition particle receptor